VLVTVQEERPVPKIIDFGLAKAVDHRLVGETLFTEHGQILGTLEYMAPEQAGFGGLDVDTRCDVYSLGVILSPTRRPNAAAWWPARSAGRCAAISTGSS
jgi:serine/threonine protein kinase